MALLMMLWPKPYRLRVSPLRILTAIVLMAAVFAEIVPASAQHFSSEENRVKASFLFNFAKFITWPATAGATRSKLLFCIVGNPEVSAILKSQAEGQSIGGRQIVIAEVNPNDSLPQLENCQMIYIGERAKNTDQVLDKVKRLPIVTVGEDIHFLQHGGIINLMHEDGRFKFQISLKAATQSGLSISSKLLQLARDVIQS
ncbi:MAG TPA: YfiR family protein [Candidatus Angelobacter sp.]|nr:YfiR family protein [Candidatus Angelobacter sp.]